MADANPRLTIKDLRSGRNGVDPPQSISETHCVEALNVDTYNATFARKRNGMVSASGLTGSPFTGVNSTLFRHVPGTDETLAELWSSDDAGTPVIGRFSGMSWTRPGRQDEPTGNGWEVNYASFGGKLFIAYQSAMDRLHVWDPYLGIIRRTGLDSSTVAGIATMADQGSGSYAAIRRYYRVRYTEQRSGVTVRRSEPTVPVNWTPSGSGSAVRITLGSVMNEGETHIELEASTDGVTFYRIITILATATVYDEIFDPSTYANSPLSDLTGTYTIQKSYRYIAVDQGRLLGFGSWSSTDAQNDVEFSAVNGSLNIGDNERVPTGNRQGLDENDSGPATALFGPVNGTFFAGKSRQFWQLTPTGQVSQPYSAAPISKVIGPVNQKSVVIGEDESGNAAIYFNSYRGPYRWGLRGLEYIGRVMEDRTLGANNGVRLNLNASHVVSHVLWYPDKRQAWFWWAVNSDNDPTEGAMFSVGYTPPYYGGYGTEPAIPSRWSRFTGLLGGSRCSCLFSNTLGAAMSKDLKPYVGLTVAAALPAKADTGTVDLSTSYQAYVITRAYVPWGDGFTGSVMAAQLTAAAQSGVTITLTTTGDFGAQTHSDTVSLTALGTETRVQPRFGGGVVLSGLQTVQWQIGDAAASSATWQLDEVSITTKKEGPVAA